MFTISIITTAIVYVLTAITAYKFRGIITMYSSKKSLCLQTLSGAIITGLIFYFEWHTFNVISNILSLASLVWSHKQLSQFTKSINSIK